MAETTRKERAAKPSVASHPLFPVVVVLWFGALFGLASLAIRPVLIEGLVSAIGIDQVIPMAAPPLGSTARILIALMMTVLGCAAGAVVARRLARPTAQPASTRRRRPAASVQAEDVPSPVALFGAERVEEVEEGQPARRRRQLAIMDAEESFDDHAPLPGSTQILSVAELPLKSFDEVDEIWLHSSDRAKPRLDDKPDLQQQIEVAQEAGYPESAAPTPAVSLDDGDNDHAHADTDGPSNRLFESYVRRVNAGIGSNDPGIPNPGFVSVPDTQTPTATYQPQDEATVPINGSAVADSLAPEPTTDAAYANTAERIASAPLDTLSHVELLERLAQTIARRRREAAQPTAAAVVTAPTAEPVWFSAPQTVAASGEMPAALRPHWLDDADDDGEALPAMVPPRSMTMKSMPAVVAGIDAPVPQDGAVEDEPIQTAVSQPEDPQVLAQGYSSLLSITKAGGRQVFGRNNDLGSDSTPVAPRAFDAPQTGEPVPDQTEQALRAALATLRRMSGTA